MDRSHGRAASYAFALTRNFNFAEPARIDLRAGFFSCGLRGTSPRVSKGSEPEPSFTVGLLPSVSVRYRSAGSFKIVSFCTKTTKRLPAGKTASSPRLKPLINASGAIGKTGAIKAPSTIVLVATSPP